MTREPENATAVAAASAREPPIDDEEDDDEDIASSRGRWAGGVLRVWGLERFPPLLKEDG
jgi:hypothetical protein